MKKKIYLQYAILALLTLGMASCSQEELIPQNGLREITPIFLTRSETGNTDNAFGAEGATMRVLSTDKQVNKTYTCHSGKWYADDLNPIVLNSTDGVVLQAYSPANASFDTFTIPEDQSSDAKLLLADWCVSDEVKLTTSSTSVKFNMTHLLCKVTVNMTLQEGMEVTQIRINNLYPIVNKDGTSGDANTILSIIPNETVKDNVITVTAIVAPGTYSNTNTFMTFYLNGVPMVLKQELELQGGNYYRFNLTVKYSDLVLTDPDISFTDWGTEGNERPLN